MESNFMHKMTSIIFLSALLCFMIPSHSIEGAKLTRAVMLSMAPNINFDCVNRNITDKNSTSTVIFSGTVSKCGKKQAGTYRCTIQIWRIMKGREFTKGLLNVESTKVFSFYRKTFADVYGFGNRGYCQSNVEKDDTRIFFLTRSNDRLLLSASMLRITLTNLQNTQDVVDGKKIVEVPKKPLDPCLLVLCGYGAHCKAVEGRPNCVCPDVTCPSSDVDTSTPVCGSNGVTYPDECHLKAAQCMEQKPIVISSQDICDSSGSVTSSTCDDVTCGYSAVCVLRKDKNGGETPTCECPTCDGVLEDPVCGSDQRTYESECAMMRTSCLEAREISVVRRQACNLCNVAAGEESDGAEACPGQCLFDDVNGEAVCCDDIACDDDDVEGAVCGSDGNTFESECAMRRYACKTSRTITSVAKGMCPPKKEMTKVIGSASLRSGRNCPGGCNPKDGRFKRFVSRFESSVNERLALQNNVDGERMEEFHVTEVRRGSVILIYEVRASTSSQPISADEKLGESSNWIHQRLYGDNGAISKVVEVEGLDFTEDSQNDFYVEDVCLDLQCEHRSACSIRKSGRSLIPSCSCQAIGDETKLSVDMACLRGSSRGSRMSIFANALTVRKRSCELDVIYTFKNACVSDSLTDPCKDIGGCHGPGQVCMSSNNQPMCGCVTCEDIIDPVCGSDGLTYRSECELTRSNCINDIDVTLRSMGECDSSCDNVKCDYGAQCEVKNEVAECVCPIVCTQSFSPVCGSDCVTYNNLCDMMRDSCSMKVDVALRHKGPCGPDECSEESGVEESGSGVDNLCACKFGATCQEGNNGVDDCSCSFSCDGRASNKVCASDGVTYENECEMEQAQCEKQRSITAVKQGPCNAECLCNEHGSLSSKCSLVTGQCMCRPGVGGQQCNRCKPGFWNFHALAEGRITGCSACRCHRDGSTRDDCDQMTGQCKCKEGVVGMKCDQCEDDASTLTSAGCTVHIIIPTQLPPSATMQTTTMKTSQSNSVVDVESSAVKDCDLSDDEDCFTSGDDQDNTDSNPSTSVHTIETSSIQPSTTKTTTEITTTTTTTTRKTTTTTLSANSFKMNGVFQKVDGVQLTFDDELLDPQSDKYKDYTQIISSAVNTYLNNPNLVGKVTSFEIESFENYYNFFYGSGVTVYFRITLADDITADEVKNELNTVSNRDHSFDITGSS